MNKNEAINFGKQYRSSVCVKPDTLVFVKLLECVEQDNKMYWVFLTETGLKDNALCTEPLIPLKGRLKSRDYDLIEARFNSRLQK